MIVEYKALLTIKNKQYKEWVPRNNQLSSNMKEIKPINQYKKRGSNGYQKVKGFQVIIYLP